MAIFTKEVSKMELKREWGFKCLERMEGSMMCLKESGRMAYLLEKGFYMSTKHKE
jgi:hypothetical protein